MWLHGCSACGSFTFTEQFYFAGPIRRNAGGNIERSFLNELPLPVDVSQCVQLEQYDTLPYYTTSTDSFRNTLEGKEAIG